jgi:hypothetical protein
VTRRRVAAIAAGLLFLLVLANQPFAELPRRVRTLAAYAPKELALRRLGGSGTAFDRQYFSFLENARRRLPVSTPGVALARPPGDPAYMYLGVYCLAPLNVVDRELLSQWGPNRGWITAEFGAHPTTDDGLFARVPEGALYGPAPGPDR